MSVSHKALISDGDGIKEIWQGRYHDGRHSHYELDKPETKYEGMMTEANKKEFFEKNPYKVIVTDMRGNETTFVFPLSYIKEHGKIMNHKTPNSNGKCDKNF